jgi:hypothetical protein
MSGRIRASKLMKNLAIAIALIVIAVSVAACFGIPKL